MKAIKFKECNLEIAKDQEEYLTLPALALQDKEGTIVTCMKLNFLERLRVLFFGMIWMSEMTFHKPVTPRLITTKKSEVIVIK